MNKNIKQAIKLLEAATGKKVKLVESQDHSSTWSKEEFSKLYKLIANHVDMREGALNVLEFKGRISPEELEVASTAEIARLFVRFVPENDFYFALSIEGIDENGDPIYES